MAAWHWSDERHLHVGDTTFLVSSMDLARVPGQLLVVKSHDVVARYLALLDAERPQRIVELGAKEGGSTALFALVADPELLISIDLAPAVPQGLLDIIEAHGLQDRLVTRFGIDQADRAALADAVQAALHGRPLDLVIDDASHILGPTRTSFEVLFPLLRPGGLFIIEDWSSEMHAAERLARIVPPTSADFDRRLDAVQAVLHTLNAPNRSLPAAVVEKLTDAWARRATWPAPEPVDAPAELPAPGLFGSLIDAAVHADVGADDGLEVRPLRPLVDLAVELMMIRAANRGIVADLWIDGDWIVVRRGPAALDPNAFRLGNSWVDVFGYLR